MTNPNRQADEGNQKEAATHKKPYLKPAFRSEEVFERMALSCGKIHPTESSCRFNRKSS
jgi:hypothetical protein